MVVQELAQTPEADKRRKLAASIQQHAPTVLDETDEIFDVSEEILRQGIVGPTSAADSLHLAYAMVHGMDALVSWNLKDLVRLKTRRMVGALCKARGYKELDIVTPEGA